MVYPSIMSVSICYCKMLNICGIKISRFYENGILAQINFGVHDIMWLQVIKKT